MAAATEMIRVNDIKLAILFGLIETIWILLAWIAFENRSGFLMFRFIHQFSEGFTGIRLSHKMFADQSGINAFNLK